MKFYIVEAKQDIENFKNKFGEKTYDDFLKAKDRLKNKGISIDLTYHIKNTTPEEMSEIIQSLYQKDTDKQRLRQIKGEDKNIRGKYKYLGEHGGYKIYEPLDHIASMDLGVNTGWCTTGRYGHYGHPEFTPSEDAAKEHWDDYVVDNGVKFFYLLDPKTMYGKYAIAVYPKTLEPNIAIGNKCIKKVNFEIYNDKDEIDYSPIDKLPLNYLPVKLKIDADAIETISNVFPVSLDLLSVEEADELPKKVREYQESYWWLRTDNSDGATYVNYNGFINNYGNYVDIDFYGVRPVLKVSNLKSSNLELYKNYILFDKGYIYIGDNKFLYNDKVIYHRFDEKTANYEKSEIKRYLDKWLKDLKSMVTIEEELKKCNKYWPEWITEDDDWSNQKFWDDVGTEPYTPTDKILDQTAGYILENGEIIYIDEYHGESESLSDVEFSSTHFEDDTCVRIYKEPTKQQYNTLEKFIDLFLDNFGYCKIETPKEYSIIDLYHDDGSTCGDYRFGFNKVYFGDYDGYDAIKIIKRSFIKMNH